MDRCASTAPTKMASIWSGLLGREIRYSGDDMDAFEKQMRNQAPSWSAFDIRMMFQGYLERGFAAEAGDVETLTEILGHQASSIRRLCRRDRHAVEGVRRCKGTTALGGK